MTLAREHLLRERQGPVLQRILRQIVNVAQCPVNRAMIAICRKILCKTGPGHDQKGFHPACCSALTE